MSFKIQQFSRNVQQKCSLRSK